MNRDTQPGRRATGTVPLLGQVGLTVMACILAGTWVGIKLDRWLATGGALTAAGILSGVALGLAAAGLLLYRSIPWKP
jgi:hypothetical protein